MECWELPGRKGQEQDLSLGEGFSSGESSRFVCVLGVPQGEKSSGDLLW
jgi:hypothetical protein